MAKEHKTGGQSQGRRANAASPLGERQGGDTPAKVKAQGRRERRTAGPDGPDATELGDAFRHRPAR